MAKDKGGHGSEKRAEHGPYSTGSHYHSGEELVPANTFEKAKLRPVDKEVTTKYGHKFNIRMSDK